MSQKIIKICDTCGKEGNDVKKHSNMSVVETFVDGGYMKNETGLRLNNYNIDLCPSCLSRVLEGKMIFARCNCANCKFYFKES